MFEILIHDKEGKITRPITIHDNFDSAFYKAEELIMGMETAGFKFYLINFNPYTWLGEKELPTKQFRSVVIKEVEIKDVR